jgi:hypothetical protein
MNLKATVENLKNKVVNVFKKKEDRLLTKEILFENVTNYSRARRLARDLLGPFASVRVAHNEIDAGRPAGCSISYTDDEGVSTTVYGNSIAEAFVKVTADLTLREVQELAGPALVSLEVAQEAVNSRNESIKLMRLAMQRRDPQPVRGRANSDARARFKMARA